MSTATYDRPLYAVPAPPSTKARFAFLLALRRRAQQGLDTLLALPRSASGWALRHVHALLDAASDHRILAWLGARIGDTAQLIRSVGLIPLAASLLSTPPVWRTAVRVSRAAGSGLAALGRGLWTRVKSLLGRAGATGSRVAQAISDIGAAVARTGRVLATHPVAQPIIRGVKRLAGLVRPLSHSVVAHRFLGLLVPALWLRVALELLVLPLLFVQGLPGGLRHAAGDTEHALAPRQRDSGTTMSEKPTVAAPAQDDESPEAAAQGWRDIAEPNNRAERRAQQQEQARARRAKSRH